ncbi:MAG: peptidase, partial [Pseudomonadota bacterium]
MRPILKSAITLMSAAILSLDANAEPIDYFMPEGVEYDDSIPVPDEYLRHGLGDKPVRHDQMVSYLTQLAIASDRISVETIGYSHEGRPILFFVVTSPENHENLDDIQARHLARVSGKSDDTIDGSDPLMLWFNYGVHGA